MIGRLLVGAFGSIWNLKRLCCEAKHPPLKKLLIAMYSLYQYENASSIAWNAHFASVPCFPHGIKGIFVAGAARIGRNCVIFQQVTIGSNTLAGSQGFGTPEIGDDCYIGAGAKIIGRVRIGHNVRIGANAVVYKDVPSNSIVVPGEQKIITREAPLDNTYYSYRGGWVSYADAQWDPVSDEATLAKLKSATSVPAQAQPSAGYSHPANPHAL